MVILANEVRRDPACHGYTVKKVSDIPVPSRDVANLFTV